MLSGHVLRRALHLRVRRDLVGIGFVDTACSGATSAAGIDIAAPGGGALPASFSRDWAIEPSGEEESGNWMMAIKTPRSRRHDRG